MAGEASFKVSNVAWAATAFFVLLFLLFAAASSNALPASALPAITYVALAFHLLMFPVIAVVPAPLWGRMAGFAWAALDTADNGMELNGVPFNITWGLRLGAHLVFAVFFVGTALETKGIVRPVAGLSALALGGYTLAAPYVAGYALMPAFVLIIVWLVLTSKWIASNEGRPDFGTVGTRLARG